MKTKKIVILTHNPSRDYFSDSMLVCELETRGHMVWIRQFLQNDIQAICTIKPDIIVLPEARNEYTVDLAQICRNMGIRVVIKMCEFGITEESIPHITDEYKRAIFGNIPYGDAVDKVLVWGPKMGELTARFSDIPREKIVSVGGYQFDQYFTPPPPVGPPPSDKPVILFVSGFPYADRNLQYSIPEAKIGEAIHSQFVASDGKKRSEFLAGLKAAAAAAALKDSYHFQSKPHPGEKDEPYRALLEGTGVELMLAKSGFQAIQHASLIVHAGSTMAYEAHLLKKPALCFCNNNQDVIFSKVSPEASDIEALIQLIQKTPLDKSNANLDIVKQLDDEYFGPVDGKSYVRIADAIERMMLEKPKKEGTCIPDEWKYNTRPRFHQKDVFYKISQWYCDGCKNQYFVPDENREMVKCPFCGIANVRIMIKTT